MGFVIAVIVIVVIAITMYSLKQLNEKTSGIYRQLAAKKNGRVAKMPYVKAIPALEIPVEEGKVFFNIAPKKINFVVISPELKNYIHLWVAEAKKVGAFKLGDPEFDQRFNIWKGPEDKEVLKSKFDQNCRQALLNLKQEVLKKAKNIWIELIHVKPQDNTFSIKIENYLLTKKGMTIEPEKIEVYEAILDKCIKAYEAFKQSAKK
ncbi:MAG: hypothetical protein R6U54_02990 [Candidatus Omnitrophota bacterium]